ncbi:MAG: universal stress protein [Reichenbachiella sp.]|uniref:universal stress protein n=1 Tax=Reichenbachiella sp. TaxID=2184521 RepID=UPI0032642488
MQNIIVPTDFSIKSFNALSLAKRIARKAKSTIYLVHVYQPPHSHYSVMGEVVKGEHDDIFAIKLIEKLKKELEILKTANEDNSFDIEVKLKIGEPYEEIKAMAKRYNADLIVIGSTGMTDSEEFFLGSLTDKIIRSMSCPVLTVKESIDDESFDNIVYATDLKEDHTAMMNLMLRFQFLFGSTIHIVKVNTAKNFKNDIDTKVALQKLADRYELKKNYTLNCYGHDDEEYGIVYFADERGADIIAMGVHEKSGFRRLISGGSIADEVADHTFRPVLTYQFQTEEK